MQLKLHPAIRAAIAFVMFALFFFAMVEWAWLDPVIKFSKFITYLLTIVWAMLIGGVCYALLPTKKTIQTTTTALKKGGKKDRVVGYWLWLGCFVLLFISALAWYIHEL